MTTEARETTKCRKCELAQTRTAKAICRRCGAHLPGGSVVTTTVLLVSRKPEPPAIIPMREVVRRAAVEAVQSLGYTTKAANALEISHARVKQLLRQSGDHTDYRRERLKKGVR